MPSQITVRLVLAGPRRGQTVTLNHHGFVDGVCSVTAPTDRMPSVLRLLERSYAAYPEGSEGLAAAEALHAKPREADDGECAVQSAGEQNPPDEVLGPVQPVGGGVAPSPAARRPVDAGLGEWDQGVLPDGDRHPDTRRTSPVDSLHAGKIRAALASLDPEDDAHWTADGLPAVAAVADAAAANVTRLQIVAVEPEFNREVSLEQKTAPPADR